MKLCNFDVGPDKPFFLLSGPCVVESEKLTFEIATSLKEITDDLGIPYIFKASFDKANRSSHNSYRGPGMEEGLRILEAIRNDLNIPIVTDVHEDTPLDDEQIMVCERGYTFGYNTLVSDMRGLATMRNTDCPVVFDATHSVQQPGGLGSKSGGERQHVPVLARAATAAGISGLFMESHPNPEEALSDGPNSWPTGRMRELLEMLMTIDSAVKTTAFLEETL